MYINASYTHIHIFILNTALPTSSLGIWGVAHKLLDHKNSPRCRHSRVKLKKRWKSSKVHIVLLFVLYLSSSSFYCFFIHLHRFIVHFSFRRHNWLQQSYFILQANGQLQSLQWSLRRSFGGGGVHRNSRIIWIKCHHVPRTAFPSGFNFHFIVAGQHITLSLSPYYCVCTLCTNEQTNS